MLALIACKHSISKSHLARYKSRLHRNLIFYGVLRRTTAYYDVLRRTTMYYGVLRRTTTYYDVLRRTTPYYDVLRLTTTYYDVLRHTTMYYNETARTSTGCRAYLAASSRRPEPSPSLSVGDAFHFYVIDTNKKIYLYPVIMANLRGHV